MKVHKSIIYYAINFNTGKFSSHICSIDNMFMVSPSSIKDVGTSWVIYKNAGDKVGTFITREKPP